MSGNLKEILTVTFTLFAVIDILGAIPLLITLKAKMGGIHEFRATIVSGILMILFFFVGEQFLTILSVDIHSFAIGGSIVIFLLGLEMVLGFEFFKSEGDTKSGALVPIAFPLIAGSGTLTTIMALKTNFDKTNILLGIMINLIIVYTVLRSLSLLEKLLGNGGLLAIRKFFGVILLAIAVKIFTINILIFTK